MNINLANRLGFLFQTILCSTDEIIEEEGIIPHSTGLKPLFSLERQYALKCFISCSQTLKIIDF